MSAETSSDIVWAATILEYEGCLSYIWDNTLSKFDENSTGLHEIVALILIAKGLENRPLGEAIRKIKKEGLADGAGIDSARNR